MNSKLTRTILIALGVGTFMLWTLEMRRAGMLESYWLLLVSLICFMSFQLMRLKAGLAAKKIAETKAKDSENTTSKNSNS